MKALAGKPTATLEEDFDLSNTTGEDDKFVLGSDAREVVMNMVAVNPSDRPSAMDGAF